MACTAGLAVAQGGGVAQERTGASRTARLADLARDIAAIVKGEVVAK